MYRALLSAPYTAATLQLLMGSAMSVQSLPRIAVTVLHWCFTAQCRPQCIAQGISHELAVLFLENDAPACRPRAVSEP